MTLERVVAWLLSMGISGLGAGMVFAQSYPNKPVRIVTGGVGGGNDFAARLIAQGLTASLGQQVIVDNRASGVIPGETVSRAPPDGYTLLVTGGTLWIGPLLQHTPYDPMRDFAPISLLTRAPNILVVHPSLPVKSVSELIALAKARPGELNYSSSGAAGGSSHLAGELFKAMAGVNITRIPYKTSASETSDLIAGHVQLAFGTAASVMPHLKSHRLKALAVTSAEPSALVPGLPTVAASGLRGYEAEQNLALLAPAKTPAPVVGLVHREVVRVLTRSDIKEKFFNLGVETVGDSPQECAAAIKAEMAKMGKLIKKTGIHGQ